MAGSLLGLRCAGMALLLAVGGVAPRPVGAAAPPASEAPFLIENEAAMDRMMAGMTVQPTGDVDRDFVAMMVAHHQGAIDMAVAVLRHGHNETIRRLAQEIIVTQQQEITAMRLAVGEPIPPPAAAPTNPVGAPAPPEMATTTTNGAIPAGMMRNHVPAGTAPSSLTAGTVQH